MTLLGLLLIMAVVIAWWSASRARSPADYFAAGRRAGVWLVGVAGTAAAVSAFTFVGGPGLFVMAGAGSLWIILSAPLTGALQCWAVGETVVRAAHRSGALTPQELLGQRFGLSGRGVAAVVVVVGSVASLAVQARAAAVLGEAFLGIPGVWVALLVMLATVLYTAVGGMRAGLVADAVQGVLMAAAAVVLAGGAMLLVGGPRAALDTLAAARPELLGSFGAVPPERALVWYLLFCLGTCAQPHYLQKFFFLRSPSQLRALPAVLTGALAATLAVWLGIGLAGMALVTRGDVVLARPDDLTPATVALLGPWAVAVACFAVLAALMSTTASFLNLAAAAVSRDVPAALGRPPRGLMVARVTTVVVAALGTGVGVASERAVAILGLAGWGFFTAALLPVFTLGLAWRGATAHGAVTAMVTGGVVDLVLEVGREHLPAGLEPGLAGAAVGILVLVALGKWASARPAAQGDQR